MNRKITSAAAAVGAFPAALTVRASGGTTDGSREGLQIGGTR
jgi:hypothetical protein